MYLLSRRNPGRHLCLVHVSGWDSGGSRFFLWAGGWKPVWE